MPPRETLPKRKLENSHIHSSSHLLGKSRMVQTDTAYLNVPRSGCQCLLHARTSFFIVRNKHYPNVVRVPVAFRGKRANDVADFQSIVQPAAGMILLRTARFRHSEQRKVSREKLGMVCRSGFRRNIQVHGIATRLPRPCDVLEV